MAHLDELPPELLSHVASYLLDEPEDLGSLRLTNHDVYAKTFDIFATKVLSHSWLMSEQSLDTLIAIAGGDDIWERWLGLARKQVDFLSDGHDLSTLVLALSRLPHLKSMEVGQWLGLDGTTRLGYGGRTITDSISRMHTTGMQDCYDEMAEVDEAEDCITCGLSYNFATLLHALAVTRQPLEQLSAYLWILHEVGRSSFRLLSGVDLKCMPALLDGSWLQTRLRDSLQHLHTLELAVSEPEALLRAKYVKNDRPESWLCDFLALLPNLQKLALFFDELDSPKHKAWNCNAFRELCKTRLPRLAILEVSNLVAHPKDLTHWLLLNSGTLIQLSLHRIRLRREATHYHKEDWTEIVEKLGTPDMQLSSIKLSCLYTIDGDLVVFDSDGRDSCLLCQPQKSHRATNYSEIKCSHVSYTSKQGVWPHAKQTVEIDWRNLDIPGGG